MAPVEVELSLVEEEKLVERARDGDGDAFGLLYDAFKDTLCRTVIYPRLRDAKAVEEVLQETFLMAIKKIGAFEWRDRSVFFWLRMIAINKCREYIAKSIRHATVDGSVLDYQPDATYQPEREVVVEDYRKVLAERINDVIAMIRPRYGDAIRMRMIEKLPRSECAEKLGVSIETFDVVFFRASKSFREAYVEKYGKI